MKIRFLKVKNYILLSLMGLLGLGGCHSSKEISQPTSEPDTPDQPTRPRREMAVMYGVPTMDYQVKGRVVNAEGKAVKGVQVILVNTTVDATADTLMGNKERIQNYIMQSSDTTDAKGEYKVTTRDMPGQTMRLVVRDIDAKKNGQYENQMVEVPFTMDDKTTQGQGWYVGSSEKEVEVKLNAKED